MAWGWKKKPKIRPFTVLLLSALLEQGPRQESCHRATCGAGLAEQEGMHQGISTAPEKRFGAKVFFSFQFGKSSCAVVQVWLAEG